MCPPTGEYVYEAVASPESARFIELNPEKDPQGAIRFQNVGRLYGFAPVRNGPKQIQGTWTVSGPRSYWSYYNADAELIYKIAKWLDQNYDKYKDRMDSNIWMTRDVLKDGMAESFVPTHPGLKRYLQEINLWTETNEKRDKYNQDIVQSYIDAYPKAVAAAEAQGINVTPTNAKWIEFWENYKAQAKLVILRKHPSLQTTAPVTYNTGYKQPVQQPPAAPPVATKPSAPGSTDVPIQIVSTEGMKPGANATLVVKTAPGAEITIEFTLPGTGTVSAYPADKKKTAGADGTVTWQWSINERTRTGEATLKLTATKDGKTGVLVQPVQIQ
jgi:archaellin